MYVKVKFSGLFYFLAGVEEDTVDINDGGTIHHVIQIMSQKYKNLPLQDEQTFFMVDNKIARKDQILTEGARVVMFRMLAGG
jgi:molybdopterin converting factor small subunit